MRAVPQAEKQARVDQGVVKSGVSRESRDEREMNSAEWIHATHMQKNIEPRRYQHIGIDKSATS